MPCFCCSRIGFLRIVSNYSQGTGLEFLEEEIHNKFLMATKVSENSDRGLFGKKINRFGVSKMALMVRVYHLLFAGCPMDSDDTVITLVEPGTSPLIAILEGAYHNFEC